MEILKIIHNNIEQVMPQDAVTQNQIEVLNTPFMVDDIFTGKLKYVKKKKNNQGVPDVTEEKEKFCQTIRHHGHA